MSESATDIDSRAKAAVERVTTSYMQRYGLNQEQALQRIYDEIVAWLADAAQVPETVDRQ